LKINNAYTGFPYFGGFKKLMNTAVRTKTQCVIFGLAAVILAFSACSPEAFTPPSASTIATAPNEVTALQLWKDYQTDPVAAAAKYQEKTFHFARVRVDQMSFLGEGGDNELYVQEGTDPNIERVKFRTDSLADIINVRDGYIVEIVGKPQGIQFGYVVVKMSWLKVIDPPGGDTRPPPEY
jgi:hypothetical protein